MTTTIEQELINLSIYYFLNSKDFKTAPVPTADILNQLNDYLKTFLRIKCEAKVTQVNNKDVFYVSYKDSNKNSNTIYFELA